MFNKLLATSDYLQQRNEQGALCRPQRWQRASRRGHIPHKAEVGGGRIGYVCEHISRLTPVEFSTVHL